MLKQRLHPVLMIMKQLLFFWGPASDRQYAHRSVLRCGALLLLTLASLGTQAQTFTDPALTDPTYNARKLQSVGRSVGSEIDGSGSVSVSANSLSAVEAQATDCFVPSDNTYIQVPRNDDGFVGPIALLSILTCMALFTTKFGLTTTVT
jgi:hypothetical protein